MGHDGNRGLVITESRFNQVNEVCDGLGGVVVSAIGKL